MMTDSENIERGLFVALEHPEALTEPEELLKAYFNSANIGLCILDSELRYLAINRTLAAIHGLPVEAHLGRQSARFSASSPTCWNRNSSKRSKQRNRSTSDIGNAPLPN
jgi:PAS domain-containing protein